MLDFQKRNASPKRTLRGRGAEGRWIGFGLLFWSGFVTTGGLASLVVNLWVAGIVAIVGGFIGLMMAAIFQVAGLESAEASAHETLFVPRGFSEGHEELRVGRSEWIRCAPTIEPVPDADPPPSSR